MKFNFSSIVAVALFVCSKIDAKLTQSQKDDLLALHRKARNELNAPDMKSISWDDSLAAKAQAYSEKCREMVHSGEGPENLAGSTTGDPVRMFNGWWDEKELFDKSGYRTDFKDVHYAGEDIGHYSQIVWSTTTKVGCGMTYCEHYKCKYLLVCRYDTGNILHRQVYAKGSSSSKSSSSSSNSSSSSSSSSNSNSKSSSSSSDRSSEHNEERKTTERKTTTVQRQATTQEPSQPTSIPEFPEEEPLVIEITNEDLANIAPVDANDDVINANDNVDTNAQNIGNDVNEDIAVNTENNDNNNNTEKDNDKDEIKEEIGQSTYQDGKTGKYVVGIAITGSIVGAAAFVFLKKNPKQYELLAENMKSIQRKASTNFKNFSEDISRKASTVKHGAKVMSRKMSYKKLNMKNNSSTSSISPDINSPMYEMSSYELPQFNVKEAYNYSINKNNESKFINTDTLERYTTMYK